jgi:hypothetical protein
MLHNSPFEPLQLFNLDSDPLEERDLFASEPKMAQELTASLQRHLQRAGAVPWQRADPEPRQLKQTTRRSGRK